MQSRKAKLNDLHIGVDDNVMDTGQSQLQSAGITNIPNAAGDTNLKSEGVKRKSAAHYRHMPQCADMLYSPSYIQLAGAKNKTLIRDCKSLIFILHSRIQYRLAIHDHFPIQPQIISIGLKLRFVEIIDTDRSIPDLIFNCLRC